VLIASFCLETLSLFITAMCTQHQFGCNFRDSVRGEIEIGQVSTELRCKPIPQDVNRFAGNFGADIDLIEWPADGAKLPGNDQSTVVNFIELLALSFYFRGNACAASTSEPGCEGQESSTGR